MKSFKRWSTAIVIDVVLAVLFYLWHFQHLEGAGNAFIFLMWALSILGVFAVFALAGEDADLSDIACGPAFSAYQALSSFAVLIAIAWVGLYMLAGVYAFVFVMMTSARTKANKQARAAS